MNCPNCKTHVSITDKRVKQHACRCGAYNRIVDGQLVLVKMRPDCRPITPHKGGRTELVHHARVTPETKDRLRVILDQRGMSYADWLTEMVDRESQ